MDAASWRNYQILFYRFVQGMAAGEAASQLGFGERHFRRQQARAALCVADWLWERAQAEGLPKGEAPGRTSSAEPAPDPPSVAPTMFSQDDVGANLAWLQSEPTPRQVALADVLVGVEDVLMRLVVARACAWTSKPRPTCRCSASTRRRCARSWPTPWPTSSPERPAAASGCAPRRWSARCACRSCPAPGRRYRAGARRER